MPALTRRELDQFTCDDPGCTNPHDEIFIHAACHMRSAVDAMYRKATGDLVFICRTCKRVVSRILVAEDPEVQRLN